jgi:hypothetical protein
MSSGGLLWGSIKDRELLDQLNICHLFKDSVPHGRICTEKNHEKPQLRWSVFNQASSGWKPLHRDDRELEAYGFLCADPVNVSELLEYSDVSAVKIKITQRSKPRRNK